MKKIVLILAGASCLGLTACDVDKTKNGAMPDVDVNVSGGALPEYNVTGPDVNVGTENKTIQVPTVDVKTADEKKGESK
jgi:hypothetical protein